MSVGNRVTFTFAVSIGAPYQSSAGWSESFYNTDDITAGALLARITGAGVDPIVQMREQLLSPGWRITSVKITPPGATRAIARKKLNGPGTFSAAGVTDINEQPYDRLVTSMASATHTRYPMFGGAPRGIVDAGGNYLGETAVRGTAAYVWNQIFFGQWQPNFFGGHYGLRHTTVGTSAPINSMTLATVGTVVATPSTPAIAVPASYIGAFTVGEPVSIRGTTTVSKIKGQWTVTFLGIVGTEAVMILKAKRGVQVNGTYTGGLTIQKLTYSYEPAVVLGVSRGGSRRPGSSSDRSRGRRSNRQ